MPQQEVTGTQSLDRMIAIINIVSKHGRNGLRATDLTRLSGLTKPTALRIVKALRRQGLIEFDAETSRYFLGPEIFLMGLMAAERFGLHRKALPNLIRIAKASEDAAFLTVRQNFHSVCVHREEGTYPLRSTVLQKGDRYPLGINAGSLALLAAMADGEVEEALRSNAAEIAADFPAIALNTIREDVRATRENGYALNPGRVVEGSWGIAVAILDSAGECIGSLSIAAVQPRLQNVDRQRELFHLLKVEADKLGNANISSR